MKVQLLITLWAFLASLFLGFSPEGASAHEFSLSEQKAKSSSESFISTDFNDLGSFAFIYDISDGQIQVATPLRGQGFIFLGLPTKKSDKEFDSNFFPSAAFKPSHIDHQLWCSFFAPIAIGFLRMELLDSIAHPPTFRL